MRTSNSQFLTMLASMEQNGDLNKSASGPYGRVNQLEKWTQLVKVLNKDPTGEMKPLEKWKKVWSDLKNNTKRKAARIQRASVAIDRETTAKLVLSDLEIRVLNIIGSPTALGLIDVKEVGVPSPPSITTPVSTTPFNTKPDFPIVHIETSSPIQDSPEHSLSPEVICSGAASPQADQENYNMTPQKSRRRRVFRHRSGWRRFQASDERWRTMFSELANEHLRLREREIEQQAQWQALFSRCLNCIELFLK